MELFFFLVSCGVVVSTAVMKLIVFFFYSKTALTQPIDRTGGRSGSGSEVQVRNKRIGNYAGVPIESLDGRSAAR